MRHRINHVFSILTASVFLMLVGSASAQCDTTFAGAVTLSTVTAGELVCTTADFSGSITVDNGGELYISHSLTGTLNIQPGGKVTVCGAAVAFYGSITIGNGGSLTLTSGTYMDMAGGTITASGVTADGNIPFRYDGDPSCYAEVNIRATTNLGAPNANPFMNSASAGTLTNSNRIYFSGLSWGYGLSTIGSGNVGNAPSFCSPVGSCSGCDVGNASSSPTVCINSAMTSITHTTSGVSSISSSSGLPTGVTASYASDQITISGTPTSAAGTYNYTIETNCGEDATGTITVNALPTVVTVTGGGAICSGASASLSASNGSSGTIYWQNTTSGGTSTATSSTSQSVSSAGTYYFRAQSAQGCWGPEGSAAVTINALPTTVTVTGGGAICSGASVSLSASNGSSGTIYWQNTTSGGTSTATASTSQSVSSVGTYYFRAQSAQGCWGPEGSAAVTFYGNVTAGTVATNQSISVGATASVLTESVGTAGGSGAYTYQWEKSTDNGVSWANAGGTDNQVTYSPGALSITTWYRRIDTDGCSNTATTNTVEIDVSMRVCSASAPSAMDGDGAGGSGAAASGGVGTITYLWEVSTNNGSSWSTAGGTNNSADYNPASITQETWYRRKAIDGSNGCEAYSNILVAGINNGSPGAVPGPVVWLKADAGTGSIGTQWADQSGNGNHYTTSGSPTVENGDSSSNYNPYIVLAGGEGFSAPISMGANYTLFTAGRKLNSDLNGTVIDGNTAGYSFAFSGNNIENTVESITSTSLAANGIQPQINIGASSGAGCDVHIYELIIYNRVLTSDSIKIIESYLETKWGVKGSDNFLSSTGTATYDVSSYANDIVGIGKECYFHQKQSQTEDDSLIITLGTISDLAATNSANGQSVNNDVSYLMIGNDGARLVGTAATSADIPDPADVGGIAILSRIDREWKVTNTNFSNDYTIEFEVIPGSLTANDIVLMVDDDGDFTSGASLYYNGDGSGINISIGSIVVGGLGVGVIPAGGVKFIALASVAAASPLPVELIQFDVEKQGDYSLITWSTAAEINNSHFIVQKSVDGIRWEDIEVVQGNGNSTEKLKYSAIDYEDCADRCYYRLKQVDFDGKYEYSMIKYLDNQDRNGSDLAVYPVPVDGSATVKFTANSTAMYSLEVFSVLGTHTYEAKLVCAEGENVFSLNTSVYAPGLYYLVIKNAEGQIMNSITFTK